MKCINCGEEGPHFVPPALGDPGFYMCKPRDICQTCGGKKQIENSSSRIAMGGSAMIPCPTCRIVLENLENVEKKYFLMTCYNNSDNHDGFFNILTDKNPVDRFIDLLNNLKEENPNRYTLIGWVEISEEQYNSLKGKI